MRITVIGAGAVGTFYGAVLARAGARVTLFGRGKHLAAVAERGAEIVSDELGRFTVRPDCVDAPAVLSPADVVFVTVPLHQLESCRDAIRRAADGDTVVIPLQNGINARELVGKCGGDGTVLYGTTNVRAAVERSGAVVHAGTHRITVAGTGANRTAARLRGLGLTVTATGDGSRAIWQKACFIVPLTAASIAGGAVPIGQLRGDAVLWPSVRAAAAEIAFLGRVPVAGVEFALDRAPGTLVPSAAADVRRGIPPAGTELPYLVEPILAVGTAPALAEIYGRARTARPAAAKGLGVL